MKLSSLQKFILVLCLGKGKVERKLFRQFYGRQIEKTNKKYQESVITKSLERLIDRELMIGFGKRTPHKWFLTHALLTKKGDKIAEEILAEKQEKLPLK